MSKEPNRNVYVGHRYVPKIFGEWDQQNEYEGLSIVTHQGTSYTSKKRVPVGIDILNDEFWVVTGNYNAQVENYREETERVSNQLDTKASLEQLEDFTNNTNQDINDFKTITNTNINDFKTVTNQDINDFKTDTNESIEITNEKIAVTQNNTVYVEDFKRLENEGNDSGRIQRAIDQAGQNGTVCFKNDTEYFLGHELTVPSFMTFKGDGVGLTGNDLITGINIQGTENASNSRILINNFTFRNFKIAIKLSSHVSPPNGSYYNNFMYNRFRNCGTGYDIGKNVNINNIIGNMFHKMTVAGVHIHNGAYKNNIIGCAFEGDTTATGVISHGGQDLIMGSYFEALETGIEASQSTTTEMGNYFAPTIVNNVVGNNYSLSLGTDENDSFPMIKLGETSIKGHRQELLIGKGDEMLRMVVPMSIRNTSGGIELIHKDPQLTLRDESENGLIYRITSSQGELQFKNSTNRIVSKVTDEGTLVTVNGISGGRVTSDNRPANPPAATIIVDRTLDKIIFWTGSEWKDAMGNIV